jgi:hypothetical protein
MKEPGQSAGLTSVKTVFSEIVTGRASRVITELEITMTGYLIDANQD